MATYWENSCSFGLRYVSWYKYLIISLVFSHLGFWSGNLFLIAPFPDLCLLVPFYLYGSLIPVVEDFFKFLGVLFDRKLSFIPHIKYLKARCLKALNLLKVLSHTDWGADRTVLLQLYRSLIRSKLDYGSIVYGSSRPSYINSLDTVHHQGLRLALGAFRTSPVESLYVEAEEPSLYLRREKLALQYAIRIAANPSNPVHKVSYSFMKVNRRLSGPSVYELHHF